jgi:erythromycin esterase
MRTGIRAGLAAAALALSVPLQAQPAMPDPILATPEEEAAAVEWLKATGKAFDPSAYDAVTLAPLAERLATARIIGIGEATHGSHQDQAFKAELIKALVRSGKLDVLILEANRIPAMGFDRYIREGSGDLAEVVQAPAFFRIWKNDEFGGLLLWLRNWNRTAERKVRIIGVDCQDGGRDSGAALAFVERYDPTTAKRLRTDLGELIAAMDSPRRRFVDWLVDAPLDRLAAAHSASAQLTAWFESAPEAARRDPTLAEAQWAARTAYQAFLSFEFEREDADKSKADPAYFARRDRFMGENALAMLAEGERGALWAHDRHVLPELPPEADAVDFVTTGSVLRKQLGAAYAAVGFTWSQGGFHATLLPTGEQWLRVSQRQTIEVFKLPNNRPGDLGHVFDRTGQRAMWVDLGELPTEGAVADWAMRPYWRGWAGGAANPDLWQTTNFETGEIPPPVDIGYDVIVWFQTISPTRLLPMPDPPFPSAP